MRQKFESQYEFAITPIEDVEILSNSRDELPPVLRALQHIYRTPGLYKAVFALLEKKIMSGVKKTGRYGMTLWEIFVFATVRLARDADYDQLHYMLNTDSQIRALVGISKFGKEEKIYSLQSVKNNVSLLDTESINEINELVVKEGHNLLKVEELNVKVDSYVLETTVHFPTDLNLP